MSADQATTLAAGEAGRAILEGEARRRGVSLAALLRDIVADQAAVSTRLGRVSGS